MASSTVRSTQDVQSKPVPVISAETFVIPLDDGRYIIYAPLRRAAFVANAAVVNFIADLKEGVFDNEADPDGSLVEFLRRLEIVDASPEQQPSSRFGGAPEPTSVTLFLTTACNLRCTYCYASAGDTPTKYMPIEVARRGIDFVSANAKKRGLPYFEISYHGGGEPTVNWRVMTKSFEYARERAAALGIGVKASTATNGVLSESQLDWIIENLDGVSLSFDGLPSSHDRHRLTVLGQPSSHIVMRTIQRFEESSFPYGLRVTVTLDQISSLAESIEFICSKFSADRIQVEPAYQMGRWASEPSAETDGFISAFREAQRRAGRFGREISFSAARVGELTNHFCGISQDSFALSPDGNVSACYEVFSEDNPWAEVFFYGQANAESDGYKFNLPVLDHLRNQSVEHREFCRGCFAKWTCAGDCYHKSLTVNGSLEFAGSDRCHITRELTRDQILTRIAQSGGWFWHELPDETGHSHAAGKEMLL